MSGGKKQKTPQYNLCLTLGSLMFFQVQMEIPMITLGFKLTPESFNALVSGHTQQLDELNELQGGIFMSQAHIEAN